MIEYLLEKYQASANSRNGYFLARAVLARHLPFVELLLRHDADPSLNDGYAVNVAIGTGDLALVKLLMEREPHERPTEELEVAEAVDGDGDGQRRKKKKKRRRESDGGGGSKRRKVQDRCKATSRMLEVAMKEENWEMVTYLQSKGEWVVALVTCTGRSVTTAQLTILTPLRAGAVPSLEALSYL